MSRYVEVASCKTCPMMRVEAIHAIRVGSDEKPGSGQTFASEVAVFRSGHCRGSYDHLIVDDDRTPPPMCPLRVGSITLSLKQSEASLSALRDTLEVDET